MSKPVIAFGDWHCNVDYALDSIDAALEMYPDAYLVHCGDFGFWETNIFSLQYYDKVKRAGDFVEPEDPEDFIGYVSALHRLLEERDSVLYVVLGNHENYWEIADLYGYTAFDLECEPFTVETPLGEFENSMRLYCTGRDEITGDLDKDGFILSPFFPRIRIAPRAHTWNWDGVQYATLGGATSIDINFRHRGSSWWEQELPNAGEVEAFKNLTKDLSVDIMFTHDAPISALRDMYKVDPSSEMYEWANESAKAVEECVNAAQPKLLVCGHHHVRRSEQADCGTLVEILDRDNASHDNNRLKVEMPSS